MGTSRSDDAGPHASGAGGRRVAADGGDPDRAPGLRLPETASGEEAAAIAAAIGTYLAEERAAAEATGSEGPAWNGRRWTFAGRIESLTGRPARVPDSAPADGWAALGRADRY